MTGSEVAEREASELEPLSPEEQALIDSAKAEIDSDSLILPALKLTQSLTAEVQDGDVEKGHIINSLTGEDYGDNVEVVVSAYFKGFFYSDRETNQSFVAQGDIAPDNWPEEYAGKAFADLPDGEEQWAAACNAKPPEHEWGNGPPISTTHNFVGYVVTEEGQPDLPVRISLMRTGKKAADKLKTLIWSARAPWDRTFILKSVSKVTNDRPYYVYDVSQGETTPADYRQAAVKLATSYQKAAASGNVDLAGDEPEAKKAAPKANEGGLDVT